MRKILVENILVRNMGLGRFDVHEIYNRLKSAHTALAVKACLLGGNSNTKCSMTFVNYSSRYISFSWGGGPKNGFAPRPDPKNGFAPRPEYGGVFDIFRGFLGV